jgi:hypothetical protein
MPKKKCDLCTVKDAEYCVCLACNKQDNNIVVNGLLTYMSTYCHRSSHGQMKTAVMAFFDATAVHVARDTLIKALEGKIECDTSRRQDSCNRTAQEAEVEDILEVFEKLNAPEAAAIRPRFMTDDLFHIPRIAPEAGSLMTVVETVSQMRKELTQLQEVVSGVRMELTGHSEIIDKVKGHEEQRSQASYASAVGIRSSGPSTAAPHASVQKAVPLPGRSGITTEIVSQALQVVASQQKDKSSLSPDGFTRVENKRRQRGTAGTSTNAGRVMAGPESLHVQLTNVHQSVDADTIREYIKDQDDQIEIKEIKDTSTDGWETRRFLVTFNMEDQEKVLKGEFWPARIYFRRWYVNRPAKDKTAGQFKAS